MFDIGDIAIVHINNKPVSYVRCESIEPDVKPKWYQVKLSFLSFPPQEVTWILKEEYINGTPFTMNGTPVQIAALPRPAKNESPKPSPKKQTKTQNIPASLISIDDIRKKKENV